MCNQGTAVQRRHCEVTDGCQADTVSTRLVYLPRDYATPIHESRFDRDRMQLTNVTHSIHETPSRAYLRPADPLEGYREGSTGREVASEDDHGDRTTCASTSK